MSVQVYKNDDLSNEAFQWKLIFDQSLANGL